MINSESIENQLSIQFRTAYGPFTNGRRDIVVADQLFLSSLNAGIQLKVVKAAVMDGLTEAEKTKRP